MKTGYIINDSLNPAEQSLFRNCPNSPQMCGSKVAANSQQIRLKFASNSLQIRAKFSSHSLQTNSLPTRFKSGSNSAAGRRGSSKDSQIQQNVLQGFTDPSQILKQHIKQGFIMF